MPIFLSRSPECQARSGCVPSRMYTPLSQDCNPCHRGPRGACSGWKKNKRSKSPCWLLTEIQATSNVPCVPSPSVASPDLLKHTLWSEIAWSLRAVHFPRLLLSLPCGRGHGIFQAKVLEWVAISGAILNSPIYHTTHIWFISKSCYKSISKTSNYIETLTPSPQNPLLLL